MEARMKARWKWFSKKKVNIRDNYLCVIITLSPKQEEKNKKTHGKAKWKTTTKKWRSKNAHDKEAHSNKIKWPTSSATTDCTEIKTKEYCHSECMEKYKLHWIFFKLANKSLLQLYVFCLSKKEKEKKFTWKQMMVNDVYESRKNTSAILFWMQGTFPATLHST